MPDENDATAFLDAYRHYIGTDIRPAAASVRRELTKWTGEGYWSRYAARESPALPTPTQRYAVRIKRPESVIDKIRRLPNKFPRGLGADSLYGMHDVLGARIVTFFQSHLRMIDEEIRTGGQFELYPDYHPRSYLPRDLMDDVGLRVEEFQVRGKKPSGYASLHYVVRTLNADGPRPWFELQVRTMLEDVWGEVEHQLAYKPEQPMDLGARHQFVILSQYLETVDTHFNLLYNHSLDRQSESEPKAEDEITPDNLPKVVMHFGYSIAQREISGLFDILEWSGIATVRQLWDRGRLEIVQAIASTYEAEVGKHADGFDVVAVLAALNQSPSVDDAKREASLHIRMTRETKETRRRLRDDRSKNHHGGPS